MAKINLKKVEEWLKEFFWYKPTFASVISATLIIIGGRSIYKNQHHEQ